MQVRLLLGSAGSGKTFRCLSEARQALCASPEGPPLVLVAPKQGTYQLEQQLLADPSLAGFTRLSILSFESLARFLFKQLNRNCPDLLSEEGRLMVLRALLARKRENLKVFRASARLNGFAQQLSQVLVEVQRARLNPSALRLLASSLSQSEGLALKLQDLAALLEGYHDWLLSHQVQDAEALTLLAAELLQTEPRPDLCIECLWVDGFAEFTESELALLSALLPYCKTATLTFCLESDSLQTPSWLSHWSMVSRNLTRCRKSFATLPGVEVFTQVLRRNDRQARLSGNPVLEHLETHWESLVPYHEPSEAIGKSLRMVSCVSREAEVVLAAREIRAFVRNGGRYHETSLLLRKLDPYYQLIQRIFTRYEIPFFLDRRESVSHHPLAELTRSALRLVAFGWQQADWFAALKSGLIQTDESEIDLLENEALARGWNQETWHRPISIPDTPKTESDRTRLKHFEAELERIRRKVVPPFEGFAGALAAARNRPSGPQLAAALRQLWDNLQVERQLEHFTTFDSSGLVGASGISVHQTVWRQMNVWLENAELAFPNETLSLREWIPILESGLSSLSIGIIPPLLDQVLVGALDRSRTPEIKLAMVLGLNEGLFPADSESGALLTDADRLELEQRDITLGSSRRRQLGHERYLAYIACTRARQKLVLTWAAQDPAGSPLIPSSVLGHIRQLFPRLEPETAPLSLGWEDAEHPSELVETFLQMRDASGQLLLEPKAAADGLGLPGLETLFQNLQQLPGSPGPEKVAPDLAARLYGPVLRTSVSRMEQFAACPFRFFVHSGLRAEERRQFELDVKEQGTFQHDVLALFHQQLRTEGKRWRDVSPEQARQRVGRIAQGLASTFREGLLDSSEETRFIASVLTESLQDFVETLTGWIHSQYRFDPVEVELPFGEGEASPAWTLQLDRGNQIELYGRIDRVDLYRPPGLNRALCVVVDYKSSHKQLEPLLLEHGLQLQLLTYLKVICQWPKAREVFGVDHIEPAGVFYVRLRGRYGSEANRTNALADPARDRRLAYRHSGRFDVRALPFLDDRPEVREGDQFNYRLTHSGELNKTCREAVDAVGFQELLERVASNLKTMGQQVYEGHAEVSPYRLGIVTACDQCAYQSVCRIDPWTHRFRVLKRDPKPQATAQP